MTDYNVEGRLITKDDWEKWLKSKEEESAKKESRYAVIEWHPYPQEKPKRNDKYLVSVKPRNIEYVTVSMFFDDQFENFHDCEVMAWAELPKPYDKRRTKNAKFKWHPYPQEKPNSLARSYLVTGIYKKKRKVSISNWYKSQNVFDKEGLFSVIAWAEMPEPYEEENNE